MSAPEIVRLSGVSRTVQTPAGVTAILQQANLSVQAGDFIVITGPSGSGKSTLLHIAALLHPADEGAVLFEGQDVSRLPDEALCRLRGRNVGMVFQRFCLLPHRTALENVIFRFRYVGAAGGDPSVLALRALERVGLAHKAHQKVRLLSAGEMQRVAIARAVVLSPRLLVADEPTGSLDEESAQVVMRLLRELHQPGRAIMLVTHNPAWIAWGTRHYTLHGGRLAAGMGNAA